VCERAREEPQHSQVHTSFFVDAVTCHQIFERPKFWDEFKAFSSASGLHLKEGLSLILLFILHSLRVLGLHWCSEFPSS
jgi:hypothetical protein